MIIVYGIKEKLNPKQSGLNMFPERFQTLTYT